MKINSFIILLLTLSIFSCSYFNRKRANRRMLDQDSLAERKPEDKFDQFRRAPASVDALKRKKRFDAERNDTTGPSLWTGRGKDSYLFTGQTEKQLGDIVQVNILGKLRREISSELKLAEVYDKWERKSTSSDDKKKEKPKEDDPTKDKKSKKSGHISTIVEEEINQTHVLLKGKKTVIFKNQKKLIEFKALVARKDITVDDTIESDKILESTIKVLR